MRRNNASGNRSGAPKPITVEHMMLLMEALRKEENRIKAVNGVADVEVTDVTLFALAWAAGRTWEDILNLRTWSIRPQANGDVVVYWCKFKSPGKVRYYHPYMYTLFTGIFAQELLTLPDRRGGGKSPHTLTDLTCDNVNKLLKSAVLGVHGHGYTHGSLRAGGLLQADKLAKAKLGHLPQAKKERMLCVLKQKPHKSFPTKMTVEYIEDATAYLTRSDVLSELLLDSISYSPLAAPKKEGAPGKGTGAVSTQHKEGHDAAVPAKKDPEDREAATPVTAEDMGLFLLERPTENERVAFMLAWATASRWEDVCGLTTDSILPQKNGDVILYWDDAPKTDKDNKYRPHSYVKFTGTFAKRLTSLQEHLRKENGEVNGVSLISLKTKDVKDRFGQIREKLNGKDYTAHSIKRGALQTAAMLADGHNIEPKMISLLAKHTDELLEEEYNAMSDADKTKPFPGSGELPQLLLAQLPDIPQAPFHDPASAKAAKLREEGTGDNTVFITAGGLRVDPAVVRKKNGKPYAREVLQQHARMLQRFEAFCKKNGLEVEASNIEAFTASLDDVKELTANSYKSSLEAVLSALEN